MPAENREGNSNSGCNPRGTANREAPPVVQEPKRIPLRCRLFGHRYRDPFIGHVIDIYLPSAEGRLGWSDPRGDLIGTCRCGKEWRSR